MRLNLGSGKRNMVGFINIDAIKHTEDTVIGDVLNLQYTDNSVEEVYSEHVIEHLDKNEIKTFFQQIHRVLCKGGKLTIVAPSIEVAINKYVNNQVTIEYVDGVLFAEHAHKYDYHKQGIYKNKLKRFCDTYGFEITTLEFQDRDHSDNEIILIAYKK